MVWLPDGEKVRGLLVLIIYTNVADIRTDGQTDGQTPHNGIGRGYA